MDAGTAIGIGIIAIVGAALLRAWYLKRTGVIAIVEPKYDPDSPYSPAGAAFMRSMREERERRQPEESQ